MNLPKLNNLPLSLKLLLMCGIVFVPLAFIMLVFAPLVALSDPYRTGTYRLEEQFGKDRFNVIIGEMKIDEYFYFYFGVLTHGNVNKAVDEAYAMLDQYRSKEALLAAMEAQRTTVNAIAVLINTMDFHEAFLESPTAYPELCKAVWRFLYEEFKLTTMAVCYKGTYNSGYQLHWNLATKDAAKKAAEVILRLNADQRKAVGELYQSML